MTNKPTHNAYDVRGYKTAKGDERSIWTKIGSGWAHEDGQGLNIRLHALPLNGEIVLRTAKERPQSTEADIEIGS